MSQQRLATRSSSRLKAQELGGGRGGEDGESQNQGQGQGPLDAVLALTTKDDFMATDDFKRLLRGYVDVEELFCTFRLVSKPWQRITEEKIDGDFRSGVLAFHDGNDVGDGIVKDIEHEFWASLRAKRELVKRVIFLLNITKVGVRACLWAANLVIVDIPEGVVSIGWYAFSVCSSLTTVSFPTTLTSIGYRAFGSCSSLENVDLLHTNLQELGESAFEDCSELKSMTIPDSLQTLDEDVFRGCSSLFPSNIDVSYDSEGDEVDTTSDVVAYLRTQQRIASLEKMVAALTTENAAQATENAAQATEIAVLGARIAQLEIALPTPPPNSFTSTIDFKRHFVGFVHIEMLLVLREVCKEWNDVVIERVDECVESGVMIVHGGKGVDDDVADAREFERQELVTQVIFLRNIVQIGENACNMTANLVVVEIPEGVEEIGRAAFWRCRSLTTVSFPTTLKLIDGVGFADCLSLEIVDLLHTNLQELGEYAFYECSKLKLMTIPDSLQTIGKWAFLGCSKLVPSNINTYDSKAVVAHLRSLQN